MSSVSSNYCVNNPMFQGNKQTKLVNVKRDNHYETRTYEIEASTGKKWGVGIASAYCPGLGQATNGDWGKAAGFFFGSMGLGLGSGLLFHKSIALGGMSGLGACALGIWGIVDAVKNARSTSTQVIPIKNNANNFDTVA